MKTLHLHPGDHAPTLSDRSLRVIIAMLAALAPYAIAAIALFAYHEQFGL